MRGPCRSATHAPVSAGTSAASRVPTMRFQPLTSSLSRPLITSWPAGEVQGSLASKSRVARHRALLPFGFCPCTHPFPQSSKLRAHDASVLGVPAAGAPGRGSRQAREGAPAARQLKATHDKGWLLACIGQRDRGNLRAVRGQASTSRYQRHAERGGHPAGTPPHGRQGQQQGTLHAGGRAKAGQGLPAQPPAARWPTTS